MKARPSIQLIMPFTIVGLPHQNDALDHHCRGGETSRPSGGQRDLMVAERLGSSGWSGTAVAPGRWQAEAAAAVSVRVHPHHSSCRMIGGNHNPD